MAKNIVLFSLLIGIILFVGLIFGAGIEKIIELLLPFSFFKYAAVFFVFFIAFIILTYRWGILLKLKGYNVPFARLFATKTSGYAIDYLTPLSRLGGEPVRAYILQRKNKVPFIDGLASVIEDKMIEFTASLFFVICGVVLVFMHYTISKNVAILMSSIVALFIFLISLFYFAMMKQKGFFSLFLKMFQIDKIKGLSKINKGTEEMEKRISELFRNNKLKVFACLMISIMESAIIMLIYVLIIYFLGYKISFLEAIVIFSLTALATAFPIPGALGSFEGFSALSFTLIGLGMSVGIAFSLVSRVMELTMVVIGIIVTYLFGVKLTIDYLKGDN